MRASLLIVASALFATPALAQQPPAPAETFAIPPELNDPQLASRMADMVQVLSKSLLNLPAGEIQAAAEGRTPTEHDKGVTVRDLGCRDHPDFERRLEGQIARSKPMMESAMKALSSALPALMRSMEEAGEALERATANMPSPTYPKR